MDFKQLMDLASQNKTRMKKQETKDVTAKTSDSKSNNSGVSDAAVKAFLAKRELERKRKAEEEEAARRARIEERLAQSLGTKKKESAKDATCSQRQKKSDSNVTAGKHPDNKNEKQKVSEHRDSKTTYQTSSKKPDTDRTRHSLEPVAKNADSNSKKSSSKGQGSVKKGAPMDFKALLAAAERNKNGSAKLLPVFEHGRSVKQEVNKLEGGGARKGSLEQSESVSRGQSRTLKDGKTKAGQMHVNGSSKLHVKEVAGKASSSIGDSNSKQNLKRSTGLLSANREKGLALKASSSVNQGKLSNPKVVHPNNDRRPMKEGQLGKRRERDTLKRKRNPYRDDLNDMGDFIDDGDGEDVDVSKYIKEIFGYDRSRFHDDDDDLAGMESSYKQIEKEEVKSAKIARLEDEIEQLKELHDLKKERDKLKKKAKK